MARQIALVGHLFVALLVEAIVEEQDQQLLRIHGDQINRIGDDEPRFRPGELLYYGVFVDGHKHYWLEQIAE